jgi:hypothetical protein
VSRQAFIAGLLLTALAHGESHPHYSLAVRIEPESHSIVVHGRLEGRQCGTESRLYLNKNFQLDSFLVAGRTTPVDFDTAAAPAQWTTVTRPLRFDCRPGTLEFAYSGVITDTIWGVNLIAPELIELAMYAGWFPYDPGLRSFTYDVELDLPEGWVLVSGGRLSRSKVAGGRQILHFASTAPAFDIAFVASPAFTVHRAAEGGATIEVYATVEDSLLATTAIQDLGQALSLFRQWFGPLRSTDEVLQATRLVYSPRGGWGYSRLPMIVVSAQTAHTWSHQRLGVARIFLGNAHELAHFWWWVADTETPDDWINEGLAEFSAFSAASALFGSEVRDSLLAEYRRSVPRGTVSTPIAATPNESPDRYLNHYQKPTLLFASLESTIGQTRLMEFLRKIYEAHHEHRDATTPAVLRIARNLLGAEAAGRLERCVTGVWTAECGQ